MESPVPLEGGCPWRAKTLPLPRPLLLPWLCSRPPLNREVWELLLCYESLLMPLPLPRWEGTPKLVAVACEIQYGLGERWLIGTIPKVRSLEA